jgi:hypothetical protein
MFFFTVLKVLHQIIYFIFRRLYCRGLEGVDHADCIHFVENYAGRSFTELGKHITAITGEICQTVFECPETPTEEPTEEPTEQPTEQPTEEPTEFDY